MSTGAARNPEASRDLTRGVSALFFWCLPIALLVVAGAMQPGVGWHVWLVVVAFSIMGAGCSINAARCSRTHCHVTGPAFLLAALWFLLSAFGVVAPHSDYVSLAVVVLVALAFVAEFPLGRHIRARKRVRCG